MAKRSFAQDDIVLIGSIDLDKSQVRLGPMDSILAFAVSGDLGLISVESCPTAIAGVHTEKGAVLNDRTVLHGVGRLFHGFGRFGLMELMRQTVEGLDQKPVDKQFPAVSEIDGMGDARGW